MKPIVDKQRVRQRFKKALATYNHHAQVQEQMAETLLQIVRQTVGSGFGRVLEIGSGTGLLTHKIRKQLTTADFYANDLVEETESFVRTAFPEARFIPGDAESAPLPGQLDLVLSNATFQWMADPRAFLGKLRTLLRPGGAVVFSSFGPDNFKEIASLTNAGLRYLDFRQLSALCEEQFQILHRHEENFALHFPDILSVLRHMQALGVNGVREHRWTRAAWHDLALRYHEAYGSRQGLPLTYHPFYFALRAL